MGRLTKEPTINGEGDKKVARFTLAVDRRFKKEGQDNTDFISCAAFSKLGEFTEKYLKKGTKVVLSGRIQTGSYNDKSGNKVYTTDVISESIEFAESKKSEETSNSSSDADFMDIPQNVKDDMPF
jgi:single-strand DNA-binding protein